MLALAVVVSADCMTARDLTAAQKACCAAMGHDCGEGAVRPDCCPAPTAQIAQLSVAKTVPLVTAPQPVLASVLALTEPLADACLAVRDFLNGSSRKPPGVPTYLLISTFRL